MKFCTEEDLTYENFRKAWKIIEELSDKAEYICWNEMFVDMDKMLEKLKEQEAMIILRLMTMKKLIRFDIKSL